ncbi:MAG: DUF2117 domain-containing protein [Candidatus Methanoperedens sp.]|nr:DUF2117 domain-containing protein [Candidatus Methanoperedens sp.]
MRIGIVLHGPEAVDDGSAERIINTLRLDHQVTAKLGGTMGRTAVLDAGLEDVIDIRLGMTPSKTIESLRGNIDIIILISRGKTLDTGRHFGSIVASRIDISIPFIHIESPFYEGKIIYYGKNGERCADYVRRLLEKHIPDLELPIESGIPLCPLFRTEGDRQIRRIYGALPGENVRIEGVVIGHITHVEPEIICRDGRVVELRGIKIKQHGLEKLDNKKIDLFNAEVKTGNIRRTKHTTKIKPARSFADGKKIVMIDHCAESTFELVGDADIAITVGDDTTTIAADILTRLGIAIIGITDGDPDSILGDAAIPAGSMIIRVKEGYDDIIGREISEKIMVGRQKLSVKSCEEIVEKVLKLAENKIVEIKSY